MTSRRPAADRRRWWLAAACFAVVLAGAACGDDGPAGPGDGDGNTVPEAQLLFLRQAASAPPLETTSLEFVATAGERTSVEIRYQPRPGEDSGERFLRFELEDGSLLRYPPDHPTRPGQAFQPGDTVHIRITVDDPALFRATFEPSGLEFSAAAPAELEFAYPEADGDFDDDGLEDPELEEEIDIWRQENPGDDWERAGTLQDIELDEVEATLTKFSRYGLAI
ncbi:MAG: hypothetical protein RRA92_06130 [Gemmatimonadota bacterium]|nr:hypothetical protein [Gemmatimonadota bacterium]